MNKHKGQWLLDIVTDVLKSDGLNKDVLFRTSNGLLRLHARKICLPECAGS